MSYMNIISKKVFLFIFIIVSVAGVQSQEIVLDRVAAVVGKNVILQSDIDAQYFQYRLQEGGIQGSESTIKCQIVENLLYQKLLLNQAQIDSVEVTDSEVEQNIDQRMRYFIAQFGSEEKLEEFYSKSILEIKEDMRELIHDQMMVERLQQQITLDVKVTPSEVRSFFKKLPEDSIPLINAEVEIGQIIRIPPVRIEEKMNVREKMKTFRERILKGEKLSTLAILYSEDPGSAKKGGELGFVGRGELYPEFEAVAFNLKKGEISEIIETEAGYHILELVERRGDYVNVRHILLRIQPTAGDLLKAKSYLDSIANLIENDSMKFAEAAQKFSDGPNAKNGGLLINPQTGTSKFEADKLDPQLFFVIDKLEVGEISRPVLYETEKGKQAYRILYLKSRTKPHVANLKEDYNKIQQLALEKKKNNKVDAWVENKIENAYIRIIDEWQDCDYYHDWFKNEL